MAILLRLSHINKDTTMHALRNTLLLLPVLWLVVPVVVIEGAYKLMKSSWDSLQPDLINYIAKG